MTFADWLLVIWLFTPPAILGVGCVWLAWVLRERRPRPKPCWWCGRVAAAGEKR